MKAIRYKWFEEIIERSIMPLSFPTEEERQEFISISQHYRLFLIDLHNPPPNTHSLQEVLKHPYTESCFPKISHLVQISNMPLELGVSFPYVVAFLGYNERFKKINEGEMPEPKQAIVLRWDMYGKPIVEHKGKALEMFLFGRQA